MRKVHLKSLFFLGIGAVMISSLSSSSLACIINQPNQIGIHLNGDGSSIYTHENSKIRLTGCVPKSSSQYIMIGLGPDIVNKNYQKGVSYTGYFHNDHCKLVHSQIKREIPYEENLKYYEKKTRTVQSCTKTIVTSLGKQPLILPPDQEGCTITRTGRNSAELKGGYCFIKTMAQAAYEISLQPDPSCDTKELGLDSFDIHATYAFFMAGDATGHATDLEHLALIPTRVVKSPPADSPHLSSHFGNELPQWPAMMAPDIHFAGIEISENLDYPQLKTSYLVSNVCEKVCEGDSCYSPCDYSIPVASETYLYKLDASGKRSMIASGYFGAGIPGKWQGIVPVQPLEIGFEAFEDPNDRFVLEMRFGYPDTYYRLAGKNLQQYLIRKINLNRGIGSAHIPALTGLGTLSKLIPQLPHVKGLPDLRHGLFHEDESTYVDPLATLTSYLSTLNWPPYYLKICDPSLEICEDAFRTSGTTKIQVEFKVDDMKGVALKNVKRESQILEDYDFVDPEPVVLDCSFSSSVSESPKN